MKRAVLVGINQYTIPGNDLRGCVNDINDLQKVLISIYGFHTEDIVMLVDKAATTNAMRKAFHTLVTQSQAGDVSVFHFSGHGSRVIDLDGDETDGYDEILCPTDLNWNDPFIDDYIRSELDKLVKGVNFTLLLDSGPSGTATRELTPVAGGGRVTAHSVVSSYRVERFLPSPHELLKAETHRKKQPYKVKQFSNRKGFIADTFNKWKRKPGTVDKKDIVAIKGVLEVGMMACRDYQTSADAYLEGSFNGAFTYALCKALRQSPNASYQDIHKLITEILAKARFDQVPQLEGAKDKFALPVFSPCA